MLRLCGLIAALLVASSISATEVRADACSQAVDRVNESIHEQAQLLVSQTSSIFSEPLRQCERNRARFPLTERTIEYSRQADAVCGGRVRSKCDTNCMIAQLRQDRIDADALCKKEAEERAEAAKPKPPPPRPSAEQQAADNACAALGAYVSMNAKDDEIREFIGPCSRNPDHQICHMTLRMIRSEGKGDRGLTCPGQANFDMTPIKPRERTPNDAADNACAMMAAYAQMDAPDDELKQFVSDCSANTNTMICQSTKEMVRDAKKSDHGLTCTGKRMSGIDNKGPSVNNAPKESRESARGSAIASPQATSPSPPPVTPPQAAIVPTLAPASDPNCAAQYAAQISELNSAFLSIEQKVKYERRCDLVEDAVRNRQRAVEARETSSRTCPASQPIGVNISPERVETDLKATCRAAAEEAKKTGGCETDPVASVDAEQQTSHRIDVLRGTNLGCPFDVQFIYSVYSRQTGESQGGLRTRCVSNGSYRRTLVSGSSDQTITLSSEWIKCAP